MSSSINRGGSVSACGLMAKKPSRAGRLLLSRRPRGEGFPAGHAMPCHFCVGVAPLRATTWRETRQPSGLEQGRGSCGPCGGGTRAQSTGTPACSAQARRQAEAREELAWGPLVAAAFALPRASSWLPPWSWRVQCPLTQSAALSLRERVHKRKWGRGDTRVGYVATVQLDFMSGANRDQRLKHQEEQ